MEYLEVKSTSTLPKIDVNYLILGTDMMMNCINCSDSFVAQRPQGIICLNRKQCNNEELEIVDKDGIYYSCRKCIADSTIVISKEGKKSCQCLPGFMSQPDGLCKKL